MNYPKELIRGIANSSYLEEDGYPSFRLFNEFDENPVRDDDYEEVSINWYDEDKAFEQILERKKENGEFQFKKGCAILSTSELDRLCNKPRTNGLLSYERRIVNGNIYHGNILLKRGTPKPKRNLIASAIALECVINIKTRE